MTAATATGFADWLRDCGPGGAAIAGRDWSGTPLGPLAAWDDGLRAALRLVLPSPAPMALLWGPEGICLPNGAFDAPGTRLGSAWPDGPGPGLPPHDASPVPGPDGRPAGLLLVARAEPDRALRESESRFRQLFESMDEGFCIIEFLDGPEGPLSDYVHVEANAAYARHAGIPDVVGQKVRSMVPAEAAGWVELYGGVLRTGTPIRFERELVATGRHLELAAFRIEPPERRQVAVLFQDMTARREVEARLRESEARFRNMADHAPVMMWVTDADGTCTYLNRAWYEFTGQTPAEAEGFGWLEAVHPDDRGWSGETFLAANARAEPFRLEYRLRGADGAYRWAIDAASPRFGPGGEFLGYIGSVTDIDERKRGEEALERRVAEAVAERTRAEDQLRQSQKMEAVGQLTGGLAHDFNNLLAGISGSLELLATRLAQGRQAEAERYVVAAQGAARRAASLTHRLLAFSRRQTLDPRPTDANRLIAGMEELVRRTVGPAVAVEVVAAGGLWPTLVDANQLENALLNLCINARDAMPGGGRLTVETANRWLDDRAARERELDPGQYVSICVSDTGTGMTPEVAAKAFDPFFTTKPLGEGTGLGLSMTYGFARQSGGQVRIYSEAGEGTMVCLYLPRHHGDAEEAAPPAQVPAAPRAGAGETVLVVDDEPTVRMLVVEVLQDLGYAAVEAADGPTGLAILRSDARIDLLVSDVGLPGGLNGRQMADAARVLRPDLKVLFVTGYAENAAVGNGLLAPGMEVMTKPFAIDTLARRIREILGGDGGGSPGESTGA